ncbi:hypothetical protein QUF90_00625 [Desulfococcaceae bacterium HSG9]|nr:hypothetical protein [Desulfococcaceae bacterium HSG9]
MFDSIPTSIWLAVTTISSVLIFLALWIYLWHSHLARNHDQHVVDIAIFETRKEQLEAEIKQQRKWLDENKETMIEIEDGRQKHTELKCELEEMQSTHAQEEKTLEEVRKKSGVLKSVVTSLTRERERIQSQVDALNARAEEIKLEVAEADKMKKVTALRTNKALMELKTKQNELKELTALYEKQKYAAKPSNKSESASSANVKKHANYSEKDSAQADVSSEIHISVI